jgi:hypothetical protein
LRPTTKRENALALKELLFIKFRKEVLYDELQKISLYFTLLCLRFALLMQCQAQH